MLNFIQVLDFCEDTKGIWKFIGQVVFVLRIVIPVIIVLLGTLDLGKAVMANKDDDIKAAQKILIKRLIYGACIFFIPLVLRVVFNLATNSTGDNSVTSGTCFECVLNKDC